MELPGASTGADEHLAFAEQLLTRYHFSADDQAIVAAEIDEIRSRVNDVNLYMAVIGEASSGKSTFINALIEDALLKMDNVFETTAAATVIKYDHEVSTTIRLLSGTVGNPVQRAVPGDQLEFLDNSFNVQRSEVLHFTARDTPISLEVFPKVHNMDVRQLIQCVTTDPSVARSVASVNVTYPGAFLADNICIIDTPGLNAQIKDLNPQQVTQNAVGFADSAIILTAANQAMPLSLVKLLQDDLGLRDHIKRCAFLITKMDWVDEDEHERIIKHVHSQIRRHFIPQGKLPPVFVAVPKASLDAQTGQQNSIDNADHWCAQFEILKRDLYDYLTRQRSTVIAEKTLRLLDKLFMTLDAHLTVLWQHFNERHNALNAAVIPDLELFTRQQKEYCYQRVAPLIRESATHLNLAGHTFREETLKEIETGIMSQSSAKDLKAYVEKDLAEVLQRRRHVIVVTAEKQRAAISKAAQASRTHFVDDFRDAYTRLKNVQRTLHWQDRQDALVSSSEDIQTFDGSSAFQGPGAGTYMTGAAIGAVIGTLIPGLGTLVGAGIGAAVSSLFGPSLDTRKTKLWNEIRPWLISEIDKTREDINTNVSNYGQAVLSQLEHSIDEYARSYHREVHKLRTEQEREAQELAALQATLERDKQGVTTRRELVRAQLERLETITF
jgi:gas vesicle protein